MSDVFLFPGQGSEAPGMGGGAVARPGLVRTLLERASRALGQDLAAIIERGTPDLARTELAQPALAAVGIGLALESGLSPSAVAGHSVGEIAAFCVAGCLAPEEAIDCVIERARLMAIRARGFPGGMAAIRASSEEQAREAIAGTQLEIAAHNGPDEWVLTGDRAALEALALPMVLLPVAGPWHSRAMADAAAQWRVSLERVKWQRPRVAIVANATGAVIENEDLGELLAGQLTQPVQWARTMQTLSATRWHIFGPGRVLRGLCRANLGTAAPVLIHDG